MIGRKSALKIAQAYEIEFYRSYETGLGSLYSSRSKEYALDYDRLYDFLYANDYQAWFCNMAQGVRGISRDRWQATRNLREFIMRLHTGETVVQGTQDWSWEQRAKLGQEYLRNLAEDLLDSRKHNQEHIEAMIRQLELDGYVYGNGRLLIPESQVLDVEEEVGVLEGLYAQLALSNRETAFHHLSLSESHFRDGNWDDSISNSRKFLECVLQEVAANHSQAAKAKELAQSTYERPARVRDYLEKEGLVETKEREALAAIYGLLSETGGHPYMAQEDQARLLRHLALTFSQFAMLRLEGSLPSQSNE